MSSRRHAASFRDPSGFLFAREGVLYRQVNECYRGHYDLLRASGLYDDLVGRGLMLAHDEVAADLADEPPAYKVLRPRVAEFISYPFEWCFSQLKDAALATLEIQALAVDKGMTLKDASAYNIAFHRGRPMLIDTLSFEAMPQPRPWVAYRQFCQHFLAPLALAARRDMRLTQLLRVHIDGVPLDLASRLLDWRSRLGSGLLIHLHLHARCQRRHQHDAAPPPATRAMSRQGLLGLLDNLRAAVQGLTWKPRGSEWAGYYDDTNYSPRAREEKKRIVAEMIAQAAPDRVWDLGANTGVFSRLASEKGAFTAAFDMDAAAVEAAYLDARRRGDERLLPLVMDLSNPSGAMGWAGQERMSLDQRGPADLVLALALVHHLAISNNVPLRQVAQYFARLGRRLIIEFVPKSDSQVQRLLASREDVFGDYTQEAFERDFGEFFVTTRREAIADTQRTLYAMTAR
ncbi:MAG: class I SAM-dependent methyltransferase [Planctomycetaceae bacterium]|nr:class I SAM-dependent methyltransferase [Planctomycetaceae bacterium]